MRINQFLAVATGLSRREADKVVASGQVTINGRLAELGTDVTSRDIVQLYGKKVTAKTPKTIMLNKPVGYVCSRQGQGNKTIYELLPLNLHYLKSIGRLDKDSSGLLLLTSDGSVAHTLTHPSFNKEKIYQVKLNKPLQSHDQNAIREGIVLEDGPSKLSLSGADKSWTIKMSEGRNRQIRRTFAALGYTVVALHRTQFGPHKLGNLARGKYVAL